MQCRMRSIDPALWFMCRSTETQYNNAYSGGDTSTPVHHLYPAQRGSPGRFTRLTVCGSEIFTQMPKQYSSASSLRPTWCSCSASCVAVRHLLDSPPPAVATVEFPAYSRLLQQFDLRHQPLVAGVLTCNGMVFSTASASSERFSAIAFLPAAGRSPRSDSTTARRLQQWQGVGVIAFLHQLHRLLPFSSSSRGSTLSSRARIASSVAAPGSRLPVARSGTDTRSDRAQTKLGGNHLLRVAVQLRRINCPLYCAARLSRIGVNCKSAGYVQTKNRTAPEWSSTVQNLLQVRFVNVDNIFYGHGVVSVVDIFFDMGA